MKSWTLVLSASSLVLLLLLAGYGVRRRHHAAGPPAPLRSTLPPPGHEVGAEISSLPHGDPGQERPQVSPGRIAERLARIEEKALGAEKLALLKEWIAEWARLDPVAAAAWTGSLPESWIIGDPSGSRSSHAVKYPLREMVARVWASQDPVSAAAWVESLPAKEALAYSPSLAAAVATEWFRQNREAAVTWAGEIADQKLRRWTTEAVYGIWAKTNPREAADWLSSRSGSIGDPETFTIFATEWARHNPRHAAAWAASLESPADRTSALLSVGLMWRIFDPQGAARWLAGLPSAHRPESLILDIGRSLPAGDPDAALRWATEFPEGAERTVALLATARHWAPRDPAAAISFFHRLPSEPARNEEMVQFAWQLLKSASSSAGTLVKQLQLPTGSYDDRSMESLERLFETWSGVDPESARAWARETSETRAGRSLKAALRRRR